MSKHDPTEEKTKRTAPPAADAPKPEAPPAAEPPASSEADVQADLSALNDRMLRLQADFDNFRKRTARERNDLYRKANEDLMQELLPVLDHFEMGMQTAEKQGLDPAIRAGFKMVQDQMTAALAKFGLTPIEAVGRPFDPNEHEAVTQVPSPDQPAHTVLQELRRGYRLGGQLLRAAKVVIAAEPPATEEEGAESGE